MADSNRPLVVETAMLDTVEAMDEFTASMPTPDTGAVVEFRGVVRNHDDGRSVRELEYEAHPSAGEVLQRAAAAAGARHPAVSRIRMAHRTGLLGIGECALLAQVSAAHRAEAFAACADLIDEVKRVLPVWKRQLFATGEDEWVNSP